MVDNVDELHDANPWQPMTDKLALAHLGKLIEELNECAAAAARCIIQGVNEAEPESDVINKDWLEHEISDVAACVVLVKRYFKLDNAKILRRVALKVQHLTQWHALLEASVAAVKPPVSNDN